MRSMTGFGTGSVELPDGRVIAEVRSVNARSLDVRTRLPEALGDTSLWAEQLVRKKLRRGRVEVSIRCEGPCGVRLAMDRDRAVQAMREFADIAGSLSAAAQPVPLSLLTAVPGLFAQRDQDVAALRAAAEAALAKALAALDGDRAREGAATGTELSSRAQLVQGLLSRVAERAESAREANRARLAERFERVGVTIDSVRIDNEIAIVLERIDVAEEVHRLGTHLSHFLNVVEGKPRPQRDATAEEPEGRRLDFLLQEMLREATTLSAKAQDANISTDIVAIKVELDRMREQVQNVE